MGNYFDEMFVDLYRVSLNYLKENYDYCFLKAMHEKIKEGNTQVLIVGCSHAMNGVIERQMSAETVNLSISSQDLYYDALHVKKAFECGKPEYCIINIGYWGLYQNLSKQKNQGRICDVTFAPLFKDSRGREAVDLENIGFDFESFHKLEAYFSKSLLKEFAREWGLKRMKEEGSFYNSLLSREENSLLHRSGYSWQNLSSENRTEVARLRTKDHNRFLKYEETKKENEQILEEMISYICSRGAIPVVAVFPQTKAYINQINPRYKEEILQFLNELEEEVYFLDMNDADLFEDADFVDSDHLNLAGARKATEFLNLYLDSIEQSGNGASRNR